MKKSENFILIFIFFIILNISYTIYSNFDTISEKFNIKKDIKSQETNITVQNETNISKDNKPKFYMLTDGNNNPIIQETFERMLKVYTYDYIIVRQDGKYGLIDINGKRILPSLYKHITPGYGKFIKVKTYDNIEILFDKDGNKIFSANNIRKHHNYFIVRNNFPNCTLYDYNFKKLFTYKDEQETKIITKNEKDYLITHVNSNIVTLDNKGKVVKEN